MMKTQIKCTNINDIGFYRIKVYLPKNASCGKLRKCP